MNDLANLLQQDITLLARRHLPEELAWPALNSCGLTFSIKRDDLLHPLASGNKLYKLWGHLQRARAQRASCILSFGGAYSNHLHALAAAGNALGIPTLGIIRGERAETLTATLRDCEAFGMKLHFVSRLEYRDKHQGACAQQLINRFPSLYIVPEGGGGAAGAEYCGALMNAVESMQSQIADGATLCVPCGTATTFSGLLQHSSGALDVMGFAAVKADYRDAVGGEPQLVRATRECLEYRETPLVTQWRIDFASARRGFARADTELLQFIAHFYKDTGVPLEPVYTGKMLLRILELARQGFWPEGHRIIALHTGGLQGVRGYPALREAMPEIYELFGDYDYA